MLKELDLIRRLLTEAKDPDKIKQLREKAKGLMNEIKTLEKELDKLDREADSLRIKIDTLYTKRGKVLASISTETDKK